MGVALPIVSNLSPSAIEAAEVWRAGSGCCLAERDTVAVEEPLAIRVDPGEGAACTVSITMRTPGHDLELAAGFLFGDGLLKNRRDIARIECDRVNSVVVKLGAGVHFEQERMQRASYITSSCGVCGKTSIEAACLAVRPIGDSMQVSQALIQSLPRRLRAVQVEFARTGGLHAAGLFNGAGELLALREDVGRHNAVDKVIGQEFLASHLPASNAILMLSGRASFELVQKAMAAGIPIVASVGAPSSLAVDLAKRCGITLLGFVRDDRFNVYSGIERLSIESG